MKDPVIMPAFVGTRTDLHERLRVTDKQELRCMTDESFENILNEAVDVSEDLAWAAWRLGEVQVLFGAAPIVENELGSIWLLASDDIYRWRKEFMRLSRIFVAEMHKTYPMLTNFVSDRNRTSQAWLRRLGFVPGIERRFRNQPFTQYTSYRR